MKNLVLIVLILFFSFGKLFPQNNCLKFNAANGEYVSISDSIVGSYPFSISAWIKIVGSNDRVIFAIADGTSKHDYYGIYVKNNKPTIRAFVNNSHSTTSATSLVNDGEWHHIVGVFAATNDRKIYVDGVLEASNATIRAFIPTLSRAAIGRWDDSTPKSYFDGNIDEVSVWSKVLTEADIRAMMYKELAGTETNLLAYYKLNETTGTTADNAQGNVDCDGTLTKMNNDDWETSAAFFGSKNCLDFDGADDYVSIGAGPTSVKSVEFWVNPASTTEYFIDMNGTAYISASSGTVSATGFTSPTIFVDGIESTTLVSGKWQHIAITSGTAINASDLEIGRLSGQEEFDGMIDEVRLWSDVRTISEVQENMCKSLVGDETDLVGYYTFDNNGGTTLPDFSGEDKDGTLKNMSVADWVSSSAFNTWLNTDDSNWATSSNWSNGTPDATSNVGISTFSGSGDVLPGSLNIDANCNNLFLASGVTISNTSNTLTVSGNVISQGAFLIGGNMTIDGTLLNSGTFTINSTSSGTGSVIFNESITGNVIVKRFLTQDRWHYISGQTNLTGNFSTLGMGLTGGVNNDQFYRWEENLNWGGNIGNWVDILNGSNGNNSTMASEGFVSSKGYAINYSSADKTLTLTGSPFTTNQSIDITRTTNSTNIGAALVGNPFTSTIAANSNADANSFLSVNSASLDATFGGIYLWDEQAGYNDNRDDYVTVSNSSAASYIEVGQAFMVVAKNSGTTAIPFNANMRKHGSSRFYKNVEQDEVSRFYMSVENIDGLYNEILVAFINGMTNGLDFSYDAGKLKGNSNISLYTNLVDDNGADFAHQALPPLSEDIVSVKTGLDVSNAGVYTFKIKELQNFDEKASIILEDKLFGTFIDFRQVGEYSFDIETPGEIRDRFVLHFACDINNIENGNQSSSSTIQTYASNGALYILNPDKKQGEVTIFNLSGQKIDAFELNGDSKQQHSINGNNAINLVEIKTTNDLVSKKVFLK